MKIALIAPRLPPQCDGVGDHAHALANALVTAGHNVLALTANHAARAAAYNAVSLGKNWNAFATARACAQILRFRPDAVLMEYTPFLYGGASPAPVVIPLFCRILGIPCTAIAHEIFYAPGSQAVRNRVKAAYFAQRDLLTLRASSRIAATNEERRERIALRIPAAAGRIDVIPIAANIEPAAPPPRTQNSSFTIVAFGVVMPRRRFDLAIEALAAVRRSIDARLIVAGRIFDRSYAQECEALAKRLGVHEYVEFTGSVSPGRVSELLSAADAAVHTTQEGSTRSSGSLLALLAHGLPVVAASTAADDPCFSDIVRHAPPSGAGLAAALLDLAANREQSRALGDRAGRRYFSDFDWNAVARSLLPRTTRTFAAPRTPASG